MIEDLYEEYWNSEQYELCRYMVLKDLNRDITNPKLRYKLSMLDYLTNRIKDSIEDLEFIQKLNPDFRKQDVARAINLLSLRLTMVPYI